MGQLPDWALQLPAAAGIIYVVIWTTPRFLKALEVMGKRWDEDRQQFRAELKEEREQFTELLEAKERAWANERMQTQKTIMALIDLAHTMVSQCQGSVPAEQRVTRGQITAASSRPANLEDKLSARNKKVEA